MRKLFRHPFFIRLMHWEYWSGAAVYAPLYPYWAWLSLKSRSLYFLTAANPSIKNGGFIMESKYDVYQLLPKHSYPETALLPPGTPAATIKQIMAQKNIDYPVIAKPDIGERGLGVKKIKNDAELEEYAQLMPVPYLIQKFIPYEREVGIFYCKMPGDKNGVITGIVNKEPVCVTGDGKSTLTDLVHNNSRYILQWEQIKALHPSLLDTVIEEGKKLVLVPYGNHSRGSKFTDETFRVTTNLTETMNRICNQIPEFYYGRLDIMFDNWADLERGEHFAIIELNGSGSEPTHIYDPKHSIFFAWREIIKHWKVLYSISKTNNKNGVPYLTYAQGSKERMSFKAIDAQLSARTW